MSEAEKMIDSVGTVVDRDDVVARLLAETAELLHRNGVHKTTLAALLLAAAENPDAPTFRSDVFEVPRSALNDALLRLRLEGKVVLTDEGYALTEPGRSEAKGLDSTPIATFLQELVGRKLLEWRVLPSSA